MDRGREAVERARAQNPVEEEPDARFRLAPREGLMRRSKGGRHARFDAGLSARQPRQPREERRLAQDDSADQRWPPDRTGQRRQRTVGRADDLGGSQPERRDERAEIGDVLRERVGDRVA